MKHINYPTPEGGVAVIIPTGIDAATTPAQIKATLEGGANP